MLYTSAAEIDFAAADCKAVPRPGRVLMTSPAFFDVAYVINPHMADHVGEVDGAEAGRQWRTLRDAYEGLGLTVNVLEGEEGLPDMVFCANQTLPYYRPTNGQRGVVVSRMHAEQRRPEVDHFQKFFREIGYEVLPLPADAGDLEGMGDAIWHPRRFLLWGGYGIRTSRSAYEFVSDQLDVPILLLELRDDSFYHLDTCLAVLDDQTVLIYPGAFTSEGLEIIHKMFERVVEAPEEEARTLFACNAHCPDGKHVLIQEGCAQTTTALREAGFIPVEVQTSEFLKAGGSVFCMKQMFW